MNNDSQRFNLKALFKVNIIFFFIIAFIGLLLVRLFYVQVIKYSFYHQSALNNQLEQSKIPATRGLIEAHEAGQLIPIVLNQQFFTIYADPTLIKNIDKTSSDLSGVLNMPKSTLKSLLETHNTRYVVVAKKVSQDQANKILGFRYPGLGSLGQDYRVYPQGDLASQLLGFVDNSGHGNYGIEQVLNNQLSGKTGYLKAITDVNGVPLAASKNNIDIPPQNGKNVVLTLDLAMQKQLQDILANAAKSEKSPLISAVIMDSNTGAIKAMANYPSYNPAHYNQVKDPNLFNNATVANPIEPGSTMKVFTAAAALNHGNVNQNTTYNDPSQWIIDGFKITNIEEDGGAGKKSIEDILNLSLNTGATWLLMQMGGGKVDLKARQVWNDYMTNHFRFGKATDIEQGYESGGIVPNPDIANQSDDQQNLAYANTSFGQGVTVTPLQMASALSSVINGGTRYEPYLVDGFADSQGNVNYNKPKVIASNVVSSNTSNSMISLLETVVKKHEEAGFKYLAFPSGYNIGGKTGTAQVPKPDGGYYDNKFNGTYLGFVGGNKPQYSVAIFVTTPTVPGYAGSYGAQPIFGNIAHMLINQSYVTPIGQ